jgi:hypothetical protein
MPLLTISRNWGTGMRSGELELELNVLEAQVF